MASPRLIGWLQRALQHEFAAARQFALQGARARWLGEDGFAAECEAAAREELQHAALLARALHERSVAPAGGAGPALPVGRTTAEMVGEALRTEAAAVALYGQALRETRGCGDAQALLQSLHDEEAQHLQALRRWQRAT